MTLVNAETGEIVTEPLDDAEAVALEGYESTIGKGLKSFHAVGKALMAIRDGRLYRDRYASFETYCETEWGISRRQADRLAAAAAVADVLEVDEARPIGLTSESQARELAPLLSNPKAMREAYDEAEQAASGTPTAENLREAVARHKPKPKPKPPMTEEEERAKRAADYQAKQEAEVMARALASVTTEEEKANRAARNAIAELTATDPVHAAAGCTDSEYRERRLVQLEQWIADHRAALQGASLHVIHGGAS